MDYLKVDLFINKLKVLPLIVSGVLAEEALQLHHTGPKVLHALTPNDLPSQVKLNLDGKGERLVQTHPKDRALALPVAQDVLMHLHRLGLVVVAVRKPVKDSKLKKIGEHDLVAKLVCSENGNTPTVRHPDKLVSVELKLRRLYKPHTVTKVREALWKEAANLCEWWIAEEKTGRWSGRLIIMAVFSDDSAQFVTRADWKVSGETKFRPVWGWGGSRFTLARTVAQVSGAEQKSRGDAASKTQGTKRKIETLSASSGSAGSSSSRTRADAAILLSLFPQGQTVAPIKSLLFKLKKNEAHAAYWSKKAIDEHGWSDRQLFKKRRGTWTSKCKKSKKQSSGSPEWVGTKEVIEKMLRDIPRRS